MPPSVEGAVVEAAPAKVNLTLHVIGRQADGYHLLDGLAAFVSVEDRVMIRPAEGPDAGLDLDVDGPFAAAAPADETNLAGRAARMLAGTCGRSPACRIALTKNLPVAAGLGGGSADAAAVLRGLARLWDLPPDDRRLREAAGRLGADVTVCLIGQTSWMSGIGEDLDAGPDLAGTPILLVNPGVPLPTAAVFRARAGAFSAPDRFGDGAERGRRLDPVDLAERLRPRRNDLTEAALALCPPVAAVLAELVATPGCLLARMSGSGATCFALYARPDEAEAAGNAIRRARPGWWAAVGRLL